MNILDDLNIPDDPHDAAAQWFAREHGGLMSEKERRVFDTWRATNPKHAQAYREMEEVWNVAQSTPDTVFKKILQRAHTPVKPGKSRRRALVLGVGSVCTAALAVTIVGPQRWLQNPAFSHRYISQRGERRDIELPDGSRLSLNTDSNVQVQFYESERRVLLEKGEVFFSVSTDPARPFIVDTGLATVKVTGTHFNVRHDIDQVTVAVESGSVEVSAGRWWHRAVRSLTAGQGVRLTQESSAFEVSPVNAAAVTAWRQGKAVFNAAPLEQIIAELNRYQARPILLQSTSLRRLRVTGVFSIEEPDSFLEVLTKIAPVAVLRHADGRREIVSR